MAEEDENPAKHFVHTHAAHFFHKFFFYAYGNTYPIDMLQYIPHDSPRANVLSIGCGDLRDVLYSILLHGRRTVNGGSAPRSLSFTLNDWEPAIHAKNIILLHLFLDCRNLLDESFIDDNIAEIMATVDIGGEPGRTAADNKPGSGQRINSDETATTAATIVGDSSMRDKAFARRIGEIFSAMYNVFVDEGVLKLIQNSAMKLAELVGSPSEWSSTGVGRYITFADDRTRDRVRAIFLCYSNESLQGKRELKRVERERAASLKEHLGWPSERPVFSSSRGMGLASLKLADHGEAYSKMRHQYWKDGFLDPFLLLRDHDEAPFGFTEACKRVNPLLLVTERKGMAYSLHYGAFPLDAFHLDVTHWKLRDERSQDGYGKLAPRVTDEQGPTTAGLHRRRRVSAKRNELRMQNAWFKTALEELAQMCGAFIKFTSTIEAHLSFVINAGDALNFCDALMALSPNLTERGDGSVGRDASGNPGKLNPIGFQQGTLQPLKLLPGVFRHERSNEFDVINTGNLADHLGILNILVATSPLLREESHSTILTVYMATVQNLHLYQNTANFYERMLCMSSHTAAILLGVVPVSHLSMVVDHADVPANLDSIRQDFSNLSGQAKGGPCTLRLTWKCPKWTFAGLSPPSGASDIRSSISPGDFVKLTLPVYKAMFAHMPTTTFMSRLRDDSMAGAMQNPKYYTGASFGRLLTVAGRRLRIEAEHFEAALEAVIRESDLLLARNLQQEMDALFHVMELACIHPSKYGNMSLPLDTRRVVLLVPKRGLSALREFKSPEIFLSLTGGPQGSSFDNHFVTIHMAYVRVRRSDNTPVQDGDDWQSLSEHLSVRDSMERDEDAELMVSTVVPTFALMLAPASETELRLRPRDSLETVHMSESTSRKLGSNLRPVFYWSTLDNRDRTAILVPGKCRDQYDPVPCSSKPLACPAKALSNGGQALMTASTASMFFRRSLGEYVIDYSLELVSKERSFLYRVTIKMANEEAKRLLKSRGCIPTVESRRDPCCLCVTLDGGKFVYAARFPFPVDSRALQLNISKKEGFVNFTVPLLAGPVENPFSLTRQCTTENGSSYLLLSSWCFPATVPLGALPKLDVNAEWAHQMVMGDLSFKPLERKAMEEGNIPSIGVFQRGLFGVKESLLKMISSTCKTHVENRPYWKHSWLCLTEKSDGGNGPSLWVWVNDFLLDSSNEALVFDCCVTLVEHRSNPVFRQLGTYGVLESPPIRFIEVGLSEFEVWRMLLPGSVERARQSYLHTAECIYSKPEDVRLTKLCDCARGKDLPPDFKDCMRAVEVSLDVKTSIQSLFFRAALSPLYVPAETLSMPPYMRSAVSPMKDAKQCAKCGNKLATLRCSRCRNATYCSKDCQREHWKIHKPFCSI